MGTFIRDNNAGYLTFDNVLAEDFTLPAVVTSFPIQTSATYTDHRQRQQATVRIQGLITETPIEEFLTGDLLTESMYSMHAADEFGSGFDGTFETIGTSSGGTVVPDDIIGRRSRLALSFWLAAENELLTYFSRRLGFWRQLLVTNITFGVTKRHDLVFDVEAVQVDFSESRRVDMPPLRTTKARPATCPTVGVGQRATTDVSPGAGGEADARDTTMATKLAEFAFDVRGADPAADALINALRGF